MIANEKKAGGKEAENRKANEIKEELPEGIVIDEVKMEKSQRRCDRISAGSKRSGGA